MNYRRGLFRVWIICSVVWIVAVIQHSIDDATYTFSYFLDRKTLVEEKRTQLKRELVLAENKLAEKRIEKKHFLEDKAEKARSKRLVELGIKPFDEKNDPNKLSDDFDVVFLETLVSNPELVIVEPNYSWLGNALSWPIIVPLFLMFCWKVVIWVKLGFLGGSNAKVFQEPIGAVLFTDEDQPCTANQIRPASSKIKSWRWLYITVAVVAALILMTAISAPNAQAILAKAAAGGTVVALVIAVRWLSEKIGHIGRK